MQMVFADVHTFSTVVCITSPLMSGGKVKVQFVSDCWVVFVLWRKHNRQHDLMYCVSIMLTLFQHPYLCLQETTFMMFFHYPKATVVKGERVLDETEHTLELMLNWYTGCYTIYLVGLCHGTTIHLNCLKTVTSILGGSFFTALLGMGSGSQAPCIITAIWALGFLSFTSYAVSKKYLMMAGPFLQKDYISRFSRLLHIWLKIPQNKMFVATVVP